MKQKSKTGLAVIGLLCTVMWMSFPILIDLAEARAGRGGSVGSRGSRSSAPPRQTFSPPPSQSQPAPTQVAPGQQQRPGMGTPAPAQSPGMGSFGRGLAGGLAGGLLGGMIGNMLFGGSGHAAGPAAGGGCTSIGFFDILIIGGLLYLGYRMLSRRRQEAYQASSAAGGVAGMPASSWQTPEPLPQPGYDLQGELDAIRRTDPAFDETAFKEKAQDAFFKLQGVWMRQEAALVRDLATPELAAILEGDLADLKARGQINKLENIAIRQVEISEAWQEQGQEYITVGFLANLLDYTVDANTNLVVAGSDTEPVKFEEYWTFSRPIGGGAWKLSAISQPEG